MKIKQNAKQGIVIFTFLILLLLLGYWMKGSGSIPLIKGGVFLLVFNFAFIFLMDRYVFIELVDDKLTISNLLTPKKKIDIKAIQQIEEMPMFNLFGKAATEMRVSYQVDTKESTAIANINPYKEKDLRMLLNLLLQVNPEIKLDHNLMTRVREA